MPGLFFRFRLATALLLVTACQSPAPPSPTATPEPTDTPAQSVEATPETMEPWASMTEYAHPQLLVEADWLAANLDDPQMRLIDIREPELYSAGHVPGAVNLPVNAIASLSRTGG